jgi:hypothetical protein
MDTELAEALTGELNDWVTALPPYQQELITQMLVGRDPTAVSLAWLSSTGPANTEPYGAIRNVPNLFYDSLLSQLQALLCSEKEYVSERKELINSAKAGRAALVTAASGYIAPHLGVSAILIAPAVALTLATAAKAGQDSFCATLSQLIEDRKSAGSENSSASDGQASS